MRFLLHMIPAVQRKCSLESLPVATATAMYLLHFSAAAGATGREDESDPPRGGKICSSRLVSSQVDCSSAIVIVPQYVVCLLAVRRSKT